MHLSFVNASIFLAFVYALYKLVFRSYRRLPPGPAGLPLIGNVYDIPGKFDWITYMEMSRKYDSSLISLHFMGSRVVIVNTHEAARDLFERRSLIYSDRPNFPMLVDLMGFGWNTGLIPYGNRWKEHRKIFRQEMEGYSSAAYHHREIHEARLLLRRLLDDPENYRKNIRFMFGRSILAITYGIDVTHDSDPYIRNVETAMQAAAACMNAGSFLVDVLPILRFIPDWFPGARFKRKAKEWRKAIIAMPVMPMAFVMRSIEDGTAEPSVAYKLLSQIEVDENRTRENEEILRDALSTFYAGGADTTVSALCSFVLAMVLYPDVQKKGQAAIDAIIGSGRLPDFKDCACIPYLQAILNEVLRWAPVLPLSVPRRCTEDNEYNGYHIPRGATVVCNSWAMLHDEAVYGPETETFNPDRFMKDGVLNPDVPFPMETFGFGRRICPGRDLAIDSIKITIVSLLAVFEFGKAVDAEGNTIEVSGEYLSGALIHPAPFKCSIRPRCEAAALLIMTDT
ncbi:cytochrome P450 [Armillaria luteobubalina]|uniref:Cytochrome P450 n=1 Tax=Armillaria luteobubalina TaxID=153913 RepID=A0AA39Q8K7_9AGAR|nr:cytochrome P450 [Armillaria luteobubalina]